MHFHVFFYLFYIFVKGNAKGSHNKEAKEPRVADPGDKQISYGAKMFEMQEQCCGQEREGLKITDSS